MKITGITEITCFYIETDDDDNYMYTRYSAENWCVRMGESDETVYDEETIKELEAEFQRMIIVSVCYKKNCIQRTTSYKCKKGDYKCLFRLTER